MTIATIEKQRDILKEVRDEVNSLAASDLPLRDYATMTLLGIVDPGLLDTYAEETVACPGSDKHGIHLWLDGFVFGVQYVGKARESSELLVNAISELNSVSKAIKSCAT